MVFHLVDSFLGRHWFCQDAKLKAEEDSAKAAAELKKLRCLGAS